MKMTSWLKKTSPRLSIVWQGTWPAGQVEPGRYLYDHELVIVTQGSCQVRLDDRVVELTAGDYLIIPPDTFHVTTVGAGGVCRHCFHFDWLPPAKKTVHALCCFYPTRPARYLIVPTPAFVPEKVGQGTWRSDAAVRPLIETLVHRWKTGEPLARETCRAVFLELLTRIVWRAGRRTVNPNRATQRAQAVKDLLDRPDTQDKNVQTLLTSLGFSYPHLCRLFQRTFGVTPVEYRTAVRLERAKVFLRDPKMTVSEAAYAAGFRDPGYFARCFRKQNGVTPTAFR
jgi:AraC-like DNA-binding protein